MMNEEIDNEVNSFFSKIKTIEELESKAETLENSLTDCRKSLTEYLKNYLKDYIYETIQVTVNPSNKKLTFTIRFFDEEEMEKFRQDHPELKNYIYGGLSYGEVEIIFKKDSI